ncbi:MAG: hypothetical protein AAF840_18975, partial [Bacteroidota bacterium]
MRLTGLFLFIFCSSYVLAQAPAKTSNTPLIRIRNYSTIDTKEPIYLLNGQIVDKSVFEQVKPD